ncbi:slipin family protein [Herbidospora mongoliensis]|uniref:slipin family protein n=1 Tax=Herbidospora mongoliensis TaxID=688067 RepID=UPI000836A66E|nr:slipin family protein [Herbidospora mongoliensis]
MATITVMEWQRVLAFRDGRFEQVLGPGRHRYNPRRTSHVTVDVRPQLMHVPGQEVLTRDGVSIRVSATASWLVTDPVAFTNGVAKPIQVLYAALQDAIRVKVAGVDLEALLTDRSAPDLEPIRAEATPLGIEVTEFRIRDLMLPGELRRAAMDAVVARERGKAVLEEARAEAAALRSLANTARLLEEHPALLQLRTLQLAGERSTTLIIDPRTPSA